MTVITTSDELRLYNRSRILSCLRKGKAQSRTGIAVSTGLSGATVTQVTADLIQDGVIGQVVSKTEHDESTDRPGRRGRPQVLLDLKPEAATIAVITVLLNKLEVVLFDYCGAPIKHQKKPIVTSTLSVKSLTDSMLKMLDKTLSKDHRSSLKHIAVVYQGIVSSDNRMMLWSPITEVRDFDLAAVLRKEYQVDVSVVNDTKMIASSLYTQQHKDNTNEDESYGVVLLSFGIGLGLFHHGELLRGGHSSATELGHMLYKPNGALCRCGRKGCVEAYASEYAIWRKAMGQSEDEPPADDIDHNAYLELVEQARNKEGLAREAFAEAGAAIGFGLTNLFALIDPFPVELVGLSTVAFELMKKTLHNNLQHYGGTDSKHMVSVQEMTDENALILDGASMLSFDIVDRQVFGFGERLMLNSE